MGRVLVGQVKTERDGSEGLLYEIECCVTGIDDVVCCGSCSRWSGQDGKRWQ